MSRKPIIAANWKMHKGPAEAVEFIEEFDNLIGDSSPVDIVLAPAFVSLSASKQALVNSELVQLASQNCHFEQQGAFTGEISIGMLQEIGVDYVIIGHSERRCIFGEDDGLINQKAKALHAADVKPIICIGETLDERDNDQVESVLRRQLTEGLMELDSDKMLDSVIAYEPVWAIGTGRTASPEQAQEAHRFTREVIGEIFGEDVSSKIRIQYGGSVKPENTEELMSQADVDGALVGGAGLDPVSFSEICKNTKV
ncbi:MAG: triose-phosphate isomerase [Verrucomicrobiaceae bacterium]|nr:triose-phosphate isomerase [Verrucomicrobiaceae bacterium]